MKTLKLEINQTRLNFVIFLLDLINNGRFDIVMFIVFFLVFSVMRFTHHRALVQLVQPRANGVAGDDKENDADHAAFLACCQSLFLIFLETEIKLKKNYLPTAPNRRRRAASAAGVDWHVNGELLLHTPSGWEIASHHSNI